MKRLFHHVAAAVHVVLGIGYHALYHIAADGAGFLGADVAIITLLQVNVQGISNFHLEVVQILLCIGTSTLLLRAIMCFTSSLVSVVIICPAFQKLLAGIYVYHGKNVKCVKGLIIL